MAYRFDPHEAVDAAIRRIAREQIDKAIDDLSPIDGDRHEGIHEARKRLKKLRGLARLAVRATPEFAARENARFRDAGRTLSGVRDRTALIEALDGLAERFENEGAAASFAAARAALERKREEAIEAMGSEDAIAAAAIGHLKDARSRLDRFVLPGGSKRNQRFLVEAMGANYRRARRDLKLAIRSKRAEDFHDLRKRIKYLGMHLKLFEALWPSVLIPWREEADRAADALGRDHDYAVLRAEMAADPLSFGPKGDLGGVLALLVRHQGELREEARERCARLLAVRPKAFERWIGTLWRLAARPE
ncbi:CHAD domain-containing protein [Aureimonas sp. ME7]|uniref:CHAD domain-containing protein n=1 Tax=Aureimonas sp. ME7 TaxID=2744252 RepID=UPI0015F4AB07|nr:CHAD domain-containing protein [Aureimonas sp. ME7]